jgi:hypothetical protein
LGKFPVGELFPKNLFSHMKQKPIMLSGSRGKGWLDSMNIRGRASLAAGTSFAALTFSLLGQIAPDSNSSPRSVAGAQELVEVERPPSGELASEGGLSAPSVTATGGTRVYRSTNIARVKTTPDSAMVMEANMGLNANWPKAMIAGYPVRPGLLILGQRAYHGQFHLSDQDKRKNDLRAMDYEFRMLMLTLGIELTKDWSADLSYEFDKLLNFYEDETLYNAKASSFSMRRMWQLTEKTLVMAEPRLRHASTKTLQKHPVDGAFFDDDGDNLQLSSTFTLVRPFGPEDRGLLMPSAGFMRTQYLRDDATGRVDYLLTASANASYQWKPWLTSQAFANFGHKFANAKSEDLTGSGARYDVWDFGFALSGNWSF